MAEIEGKFQICLIVKEFVDCGDSIELQTISDYLESCSSWNDVKESLTFLIKRIEGKLNGN